MSINLADFVMDIRGRKYLPTAPRVAKMREEHPDWTIISDPVGEDLVRATVMDDTGRILAVAHKTITKWAGGDYEKAETGAIGRALSLCGYGTLQALDLDEGEDLADSPQGRPEQPPAPSAPQQGKNSQPRQERTPAQRTAPRKAAPAPAMEPELRLDEAGGGPVGGYWGAQLESATTPRELGKLILQVAEEEEDKGRKAQVIMAAGAKLQALDLDVSKRVEIAEWLSDTVKLEAAQNVASRLRVQAAAEAVIADAKKTAVAA